MPCWCQAVRRVALQRMEARSALCAETAGQDRRHATRAHSKARAWTAIVEQPVLRRTVRGAGLNRGTCSLGAPRSRIGHEPRNKPATRAVASPCIVIEIAGFLLPGLPAGSCCRRSGSRSRASRICSSGTSRTTTSRLQHSHGYERRDSQPCSVGASAEADTQASADRQILARCGSAHRARPCAADVPCSP